MSLRTPDSFKPYKDIQRAVDVIAEARDAVKRSPNLMADCPDYRAYVEYWTNRYEQLKADGWTFTKGKGWTLVTPK